MITRPLNLESVLQRPSTSFPFLALADVVALFMAFSLFHSSFVSSPSPGIDLQVPDLEIQGDVGAAWSGTQHSEILSVTANERVFFAGESFNTGDLERRLREHFSTREGVVLLVRMDGRMNLEQQLMVLEKIRRAGVKEVRLAVRAEEVGRGPGDFTPSP
ncbi:MAG: biopolymer transporter ExbD [Opitutales bacterium]|nr:biopolymer transporter ExbD [Opitutales bacterium]MCH8540141.1 biopolymer transporter ExbD [Opitutales bacterium]